MIAALAVVEPAQCPLPAFIRIVNERCRRAHRSLRELDISPPLRHVHVDCALRGPDPVVRLVRTPLLIPLLVSAFYNIHPPFDAGKIDPPSLSGSWWDVRVRYGLFQN